MLLSVGPKQTMYNCCIKITAPNYIFVTSFVFISSMGTFDHLPREIWEIILYHAGNSAKRGRTMAVNKNWYLMYLSITFTAPSIRLTCSRSKYYDIIMSPFRPGQWTTSINFKFFKADTSNNTDITQDKLYRLMKHTPHVQEVTFHDIDIVDEKDWTYFCKVLKEADTWKLRYLPDNWRVGHVDTRININLVYLTYLRCARYVRSSLESLQVVAVMIPTPNFSRLNGFTALTFIHLDKGVLKNANDLDSVLQYTPSLEEMDADFEKTDLEDLDRKPLSGVYPNVKILTFRNFEPQTNNQLSMFTNTFTGLRRLYIIGDSNRPLATSTLDPETAQVFFRRLESLLDYRIKFIGDVNSIARFLTENCPQGVNVCITSNIDVLCSQVIYDESVVIKKTNLVSEMAIQYQLYNKEDTDSLVGSRLLSKLGPNVHQLEFFRLRRIITKVYLNVLFNKEHKKLTALIFTKLDFDKHAVPQAAIYTGHIRSLKFDRCRVSRNGLQLLSSFFTQLNLLHFKSCSFDGTYGISYTNVSMPETSIHTISISYDKDDDIAAPNSRDAHTFPLVSITLAEKGETRYYYTRDEGVPIAVETTKTQFDLLREDVPYAAYSSVVTICVRSIKVLSLRICDVKTRNIQIVY